MGNGKEMRRRLSNLANEAWRSREATMLSSLASQLWRLRPRAVVAGGTGPPPRPSIQSFKDSSMSKIQRMRNLSADDSETQQLDARPQGLSRRDAVLGLAAGSAAVALSGTLVGCAAPAEEPESSALGTDDVAVVPVDFDLSVSAPGASPVYPYVLPALGFADDAVEAVVDARTMEIHHDKHHQGYTNKLNAALESSPEMQSLSLIALLSDLDGLPDSVRTAVRNNGGGYLNHSLFWPLLQPGGATGPEGDLAVAIDEQYGSVDEFREIFGQQAKGLFGSGWVWLTVDESGRLQIARYANQDTPLAQGHKPVLGIDVWEHAYYLKYQNRRADYVNNFMDAVNWSQASANFAA